MAIPQDLSDVNVLLPWQSYHVMRRSDALWNYCSFLQSFSISLYFKPQLSNILYFPSFLSIVSYKEGKLNLVCKSLMCNKQLKDLKYIFTLLAKFIHIDYIMYFVIIFENIFMHIFINKINAALNYVYIYIFQICDIQFLSYRYHDKFFFFWVCIFLL